MITLNARALLITIKLFTNNKNIYIQSQTFFMYNSITCSAACMKPTQKPTVDSRSWVDHHSSGYKKCGFIGNIIKTESSAMLVGKIPITENNSYAVTVLNLFQPIGLGIVNQKYRGQDSLVNLQSPCWIQYKSDKKLWVNSKQQNGVGKGFQQGDTVTVSVDLKSGRIQWKVGQQLRFKVEDQSIKQKDVEWVPYIFIGGTLDDKYPNQISID